MKIYDVKKFKIEMTCALVKIKNPFGFLQSVYFESVFLKVYFFSVIPKLAFFESVFSKQIKRYKDLSSTVS